MISLAQPTYFHSRGVAVKLSVANLCYIYGCIYSTLGNLQWQLKMLIILHAGKTSTTSRFCYSVGQPLSTHRQHSYSATDVTPSSSDSLPANLVVHQHHFVTVVDADCPHARCTHSHVDNSGSQSCSDLSSRELGTEGECASNWCR